MFLKLSKLSSMGVLEGGGGGGGGQQATCLVAKQAVEFPQVLAIVHIIGHYTMYFRPK